MKVVIVTSPGDQLVAEILDWQGSIPRKGDYIFHPLEERGKDDRPLGIMSVKCVTYRMLARSKDVNHFVGSEHPYVQIEV